MTQQAFVIDQSRCIGCHACTVACKVEHGVELGVFRTWVKYIEKGDFPDTQRHFSVMRCNHCTDAPCVKACPTTALFKRDDGVVDFDSDRCIGCKTCMNACPYDALHIDPDTDTAAKCNFCAHRLEVDLRPSCEVVCPVGAIISGDVDDPQSPVSVALQGAEPAVRSPEQGTGPNVFYIGGDVASIDPLATSAREGGFLTTEVTQSLLDKLEPLQESAQAVTRTDVSHPSPWGWRVSSYFLSKGVAAGAMMLAFALMLVADDSTLARWVPGILALGGIGVTGCLLVWDLKRPDRFYYLFTKPQWGSWLVRGAQIINVAGAVATAWTAAALLGWDDVRHVLTWAMLVAGVALAGYTALLFNQCEGRDFWQSRLLLPHTLVNALVAGAGGLAIVAMFAAPPSALLELLAWVLVAGTVASALIVVADTFGQHHSAHAAQAARNLWRGPFAHEFWAGIVVGVLGVVPAAGSYIAIGEGTALLGIAAVAALVGLWLYEDAWVRAGQSVPLS